MVYSLVACSLFLISFAMPWEWIVIFGLLLLGSLPLLRMPGRVKYVAVTLLAGCAALSAIPARTIIKDAQRRAPDHRQVTNRPVEIQDRGFVSSGSCRACHPQEYATWHASYHRTMTQLASEESVVGDFNDVTLTAGQRVFRLFRRDDRYWVAIQDEHDAAKFDEREIVMTTGSHHMQFYWYETGIARELGKLPFVFLFSENRWVPADSTFLRPPSRVGTLETGQWNQNCVNCHTTGAQPRIEFAKIDRGAIGEIQSTDTRVAEFGIACEACHGPAEQHVRLNVNPGRRYVHHLREQPDDSTVQPERLPAKLTSQVCGQCHGISLPKNVNFMRRIMWDGLGYRAGDDLDGSRSDRVVVRTDLRHPMIRESLARDPSYLESLFWSDGMVRVAGREYNGLINSPCYQHHDETQEVMSCMSCHELHPHGEQSQGLKSWADDQLKAGMRGDHACLQCHTDYRDQDFMQAHTHHQTESSGSRCYNCHMPHTTYGLLKGIRSHTVSKPNVEESAFVGRPNACNLCHLDQTLQWTADHLQDWYSVESPILTRDQEQIAASVLWTLQGDAGLRALVAWHMGWQPAVDVSGADWMPPYLAVLMADSYDAVRYIAYHSLAKQTRFSEFDYDYMDPQDRADAVDRVSRIWAEDADRSHWVTGDHLLIRDDGTLSKEKLGQLLGTRDNRPVWLNE